MLPDSGRHILSYASRQSDAAEVVISPTLGDAGGNACDESTRFVVRPMNMASLPGERVLLRLDRGGALAIDRDLASAVQACSVFRTVEQHVQLATVRGLCGIDRQQAVQKLLEELQARGGLLSPEELLAADVGSPTAIPEISYLVVEPHHQLDQAALTLASYAENLACHGRSPIVLVLDPSDDGTDGRGPRLGEVSRRFGLTTRHVGRHERRAMARLLARESGLPEDLVSLAMVGDRGTGVHLNGVFLETLRSAVMVVRAGLRCQTARLQDDRPGLFIANSNAFLKTAIFDNRSALMSGVRVLDMDLVGAHQQYLGLSLGALVSRQPCVDIDRAAVNFLACARPRQICLTATMSGAYGTLGDEDPLGTLLDRDILDSRLLTTPQLYRRAQRHEHSWKGVSELTVGRIGVFDLRATAIWNRLGHLPPLLPFLDHPEAVFGWMVAAVDEGALFGCLPLAVNVEIDPPSDPGWLFDGVGLVLSTFLSWWRPVC